MKGDLQAVLENQPRTQSECPQSLIPQLQLHLLGVSAAFCHLDDQPHLNTDVSPG